MNRQNLRLFLLVTITLIFLSTQAIPVGQAASALKRIRFAPGATSAQVSGALPGLSSARYVLRALAGQLLEADLSAPPGANLGDRTVGFTNPKYLTASDRLNVPPSCNSCPLVVRGDPV